MLLAYFTVVLIVGSASAAPSREKRFDHGDYFGFPFAYPRTMAAAYAGWPFFGPMPPMYWPTVPDFTTLITPWYKGSNVCETKKVFDTPDEMKEWMLDGFSDSSVNFRDESESCRGNNEKYVCMKRVNTNEGAKMEMTKYECCWGFVRSPDGKPGCVESSGESSFKPTSAPQSSSIIKLSDQAKYSYIKSGSNSRSRSGVESVPIQ